MKRAEQRTEQPTNTHVAIFAAYRRGWIRAARTSRIGIIVVVTAATIVIRLVIASSIASRWSAARVTSFFAAIFVAVVFG